MAALVPGTEPGTSVIVSDWEEAATLLRCSQEDIVKFLSHRLIETVKVGRYSYPVHSDLVAVSKLEQDGMSLEALLWRRKSGSARQS